MSQTISRERLSQYYSYMETFYDKASEDILWHLSQFLDGDPAIKAFKGSMKISHRVKPQSSIFRKCERDKISDVNDIPTKVEDVIGIRIATANKEQARTLWEALQHSRERWFCVTNSSPKFVPYTVSAKNNYSLQTGYQAYHITFVFSQSYKPLTEEASWPVEMQIMSQLWEFWAEYSRRYFYGSLPTKTTAAYNLVVSKLLDAADDLMIATTEAIMQSRKEATGGVAAK